MLNHKETTDVYNDYVDLAPVVAAASVEMAKTVRVIENEADADSGAHTSKWVLVTSRPGFFDQPGLQLSQPVAIPRDLEPWTDNHSNLWRVLRF